MNLSQVDALVAEHVMGWKWYVPSKLWNEIYAVKDDRGRYLSPEEYCPVGDGFRTLDVHVAPYSSRVQYAWQVLERLKMYEPRLCWSDEEHVWFLHFLKTAEIFRPLQTLPRPSSPEAPLAICLAALQLKGIEVSE